MSKKNLGNYGGTKSALKAGASTEHALIHGNASLGGLERAGNNVTVHGKYRNDKTDGTEQLADFSEQVPVSGSREVTNPLPKFNTVKRKPAHS